MELAVRSTTFDPNDPFERWIRLCMAVMIGLFFCIILFGCSVQRPDTNLYVVNAAFHQARGYNLRADYDQDGNLLSTARAKVIPANQVQDLNKFICTDPDGFANLKAYVQQIRAAYQSCASGN
jgi:hypothetical protein